MRRLLRDPLSIVLIIVIVLALTAAGLVAAELIARNIADDKVATAVTCVVQDDVSVSFGSTPFLWQHVTGHYDDIAVKTAGNQVREAKGMTAEIFIDDVRLDGGDNGKGTIGALNTTITWTTEGIKQTVQESIPVFGGFISDVKPNPGDGTIQVQGQFGTEVTIKPQVKGDGIGLEVEKLDLIAGIPLPSEGLQPILDTFTKKFTTGYPLGIHAESVKVTDNGVTARFVSAPNASIPEDSENDCFKDL